MKIVRSEELLDQLKLNFPGFLPYLESFLERFSSYEGLFIQLMPFSKYTIDIIKSNDEKEIKRIFDFTELLICNGDENVQAVMTTGFLEALMNNDPDEIQFTNFVQYMGKNSIEYCRAWDTFTGCKTKGLWDDKS